ncbi:MAG: DUF3604 domain-containing protein [Gammaproteobacteria bacterium]|nr:DUF3604 domain-containing protein [Gammaproteobacteria bacterium]
MLDKSISLLVSMACTLAGAIAFGAESYSPDVERSYPTEVYWGDTHVHTSYSTGDAYLIGANEVTPAVAYRFARGEVVTAWNGMKARIRKPLDFLVIADHAEGLGVAYELRGGNSELANSDVGRAMQKAWEAFEADPTSRPAVNAFRAASRGHIDERIQRAIWHSVVSNAEAFNDPGRFTALVGYEWTSGGATPGRRGNLHRTVIFADDPDKTGQILPFSAVDSPNPEDLWAFLKNYKDSTGGDVMAIPHNSNLSNGEMFARHTFDGGELTAQWAKLRNDIERLVEVTQQKGDSEAHPVLSPTDEYADFETWNSWRGRTPEPGDHNCCQDRKDPSFDAEALARMKRGEYVRPALKAGLDLAATLGVNPFKYGIIGSTDTHTSLASADEDNFWAQYPNTPPTAERPMDRFVPAWERPLQWETGAQGYAAVWAHENTRKSIFAAMHKKEVYATTGPRITVRVFAGWNFTPADAAAPNLARVGYAKGVPMGGDLLRGPRGRAPTFLLAALRDPDGANLDRIQVIKCWRDDTGELHEKIYDVALSDGRKVKRGRAEPIGSTVDVANASYTNEIGDSELRTAWTDPDFDPRLYAFYYVRVLEIPTPRWPAFDAKFFGVGGYPAEVSMVIQERAYTSPIWYTP